MINSGNGTTIDLEWLKEKIREGSYYYSSHGDEERLNDSLKLEEVKEALLSGRVLEEYEDTGRGESCLIVGFTESGKPIHIICGKRGDFVVIITVYIPKPPKFKTPYERSEE